MTRYQRIVAARNAGGNRTWAEIAAEFGITANACRGIYSRSRTPERLRAYSESESRRHRDRHGNRQADILRAVAERRAQAARLKDKGLAPMEIATVVGVSWTTVYKYLREART